MAEHCELNEDGTSSCHGQTVWSMAALYGGAAILLGTFLAMFFLSFYLTRDQSLADDPVYTFTAVWVFAGAVWLVVCWKLRTWKNICIKRLMFILAIGLIARVLMLPSGVILEDDYYRYLWDGGVTANGYNPYSLPPGAFQTAPDQEAETLAAIETPEKLKEEAKLAGDVIEHVNHSHIKTIYPPTAQAAFALAYYIDPYGVMGWRIVILVMEIIAVILAIGVLSKLKLPLIWIIIYWWNPLVVKEYANATHMDIILAPLLIGMIWLGLKHRTMLATLLLMLAVGVKVWPIILLPLLWRSRLTRRPIDWAVLCVCGLIVLVLGGLLYWPIHTGGLDETSGFIRYSESWQNNDGLYKIVLAVTQWCCSVMGEEAWHAQAHARRVVSAFIAILAISLAFFPWCGKWSAESEFNPEMGAKWIRRMMILSATLFMFSPTVFPWYYLWPLVFLIFTPNWPLLLYVVTLPLYAIQFKLWDTGGVESWEWFQTYVPWFEHGPIWLVLIASWGYWLFTMKKRKTHVELPANIEDQPLDKTEGQTQQHAG